MKVTKIKLKNLLGFDEFEVSPGKFTHIEGRNGSGKTSILEAIKFALGGGSDATVLRKGATEGEAVITLDDSVVVKKTVMEDGTCTLTVTDGDRGRLGKGQTWLNALTDIMATNPLAFLMEKGAEQVRLLAEALPMEITTEELVAAIHAKKDRDYMTRVLMGFSPKKGEHALDVIERARKLVFDERTGVNRTVKEREGTLAQLRETYDPKLAETDWAATLEEMRERKRDLERAGETFQREGSDRLAQAEADVRNASQKTIIGLQAARDVKIEAAKDEYEKLAGAERDAMETRIKDAKHPIHAELGPKGDELAAEIKEIGEQIAASTAKAEQSTRAIAAKKSIEDQETKMAVEVQRTGTLNTLLLSLDSLREERLKNVPIKGLQFQLGKVLVDGVEFHRLNTARQIAIAIQVAKLRAKELGLVCCDGLERLDPEAFKEFKKQAAESGLQFIVTRVTDADLTVTGGAA